MKSLFDQASALFTPAVMDRLHSFLGETPETLYQAVRGSVSALVGEAIDQGSTEEGATSLFSQLSHGHYSGAIPADWNAGLQSGRGVLEALFGERLISARDMVAGTSSVSVGTASSVLALAAPLVMSVLGNAAHNAGGAQNFMEVLASQKGRALAAGPAAVTSVVEDGGLTWRHILPMILMGAVLFAVPLLYRSCGEAAAPQVVAPVVPAGLPVAAEPVKEKIALPNGGEIAAFPGTMNYALAKFLESTEPAPKRFTFDHLNFESGTTVITPESRPTLADLVKILKAYPNADALLEGHTDSVGSPEANKKLSEERAAVIKTTLEIDGIAQKRLTTAGYGEEKPVASNATEEGRAKNRRLELVVLKK
jgi:OmpA-OmpF porin, OOP family